MGIENYKLGPCKVFLDDVELGLTKEGVKLFIGTTQHEVTVDQFGTTVLEMIETGKSIRVEANLAEWTADNLVRAIPNAEKIVDGTKVKINIAPIVGDNLSQYAKKLVLHPTRLDNTDKSEDVTIWKAASNQEQEFGYDFENPRILKLNFIALPDTTKPQKEQFLVIGDSTASADTTPPTVSNVAPPDGGTGQGVDDPIYVTFSEEILQQSINNNNFILLKKSTNTPVDVNLSPSSNSKTVTIEPDSSLDALTDYVLVITTSVEDVNDNNLEDVFTSEFTTA